MKNRTRFTYMLVAALVGLLALTACASRASALETTSCEGCEGALAEQGRGYGNVARVDAERVARVAHTITGSVRLFGTVAAARLAAEMEELGIGGLLTDAKSVLERLQVEMKQLCVALEKFLDSEAGDSGSS